MTSYTAGLALQICACAGFISATIVFLLSWMYFFHYEHYTSLLYQIDTFSMIFYKTLFLILHILFALWLYALYMEIKLRNLGFPLSKEAILIMSLFPVVNIFGLFLVFIYFILAMRRQVHTANTHLILIALLVPILLWVYYYKQGFNLYLFFSGSMEPIIYLIARGSEVIIMLLLFLVVTSVSSTLNALFRSTFQNYS